MLSIWIFPFLPNLHTHTQEQQTFLVGVNGSRANSAPCFGILDILLKFVKPSFSHM